VNAARRQALRSVFRQNQASRSNENYPAANRIPTKSRGSRHPKQHRRGLPFIRRDTEDTGEVQRGSADQTGDRRPQGKAGTLKNIVANLWKMDDRATSELMKRFYQGLLGPERLRPAGALRQAQLSIWKQKQWREPYYWAAFVLQGEWK
jgi:CHAT domain